MKKILLIVMVCSLLLSCAVIGQNFHYLRIKDLVLGETTKSEAESMLGGPGSSKSISNNDGDFEVIQYLYASGSMVSVQARLLWLEFKDDKLNAYIHVSGFKEDETIFNFNAKNNIVRNSSTKAEVFQILGEPSGKALFPTTLKDFGEGEEDLSEVWSWTYTSPSVGLDTSTIKSQSLHVYFDVQGIVQKIIAEKEN
ncbi:MAG: hypothetical protein RAO94_09810 [Candidatus Stygibacter australis]|nr:hypothetical protein [Candidatus Stygibacter australis]MDP8322632.1 hypothetical protein [Candidatus Stygibacter australis]